MYDLEEDQQIDHRRRYWCLIWKKIFLCLCYQRWY